MHLTPEILEAEYNFLRVCPPFRRWRMPDSDEVCFRIIRSHQCSGRYHLNAKHGHVIEINALWVATPGKLQKTMAHEMIHLHLQIDCPTDQAHHGYRFEAKAKQVCRHFYLDPAEF